MGNGRGHHHQWLRGLMDKAPDFGSGDIRDIREMREIREIRVIGDIRDIGDI